MSKAVASGPQFFDSQWTRKIAQRAALIKTGWELWFDNHVAEEYSDNTQTLYIFWAIFWHFSSLGFWSSLFGDKESGRLTFSDKIPGFLPSNWTIRLCWNTTWVCEYSFIGFVSFKSMQEYGSFCLKKLPFQFNIEWKENDHAYLCICICKRVFVSWNWIIWKEVGERLASCPRGPLSLFFLHRNSCVLLN